MKIGYFSSKFPYQKNGGFYYPFGGSVIATYHLALEMQIRHHEVNIFTTAYDNKDSIEKLHNIKIFRYATIMNFLSSSISLNLFFKPFSHDVDIVHCSFDIPPSPFAGLKYAKKKKLPLIITYHGDWDSSYGTLLRKIGVHFCNRFLVDKILDFATVIISPSRTYIEKSDFLKKYSEKIVVIPNGINLSELDTALSKSECRTILNLPQNRKIILFFGYLSPYKGPENLLKAIPLIIKIIPEILLVFVGEGILKDTLLNLSKTLHLENNVKFYGHLDDDYKSLCYKSADIFCLPSIMRTECFPITILESMAMGTPVVASNIGGIPDALSDNVEGKLVEPNNIEELADAIVKILIDENIQKQFGQNAKIKSQQYSWDLIASQTNILYEKVLGEK